MDQSQIVRDVMTPDPVALEANATVAEAAQAMERRDIGDVLVHRNGKLVGIVTDRDLVVRCLAGTTNDASSRRLGDICTRDVTTIEADADVEDAIRLMTDHAIRRVPVVENGKPVGIVSLGDLAIARDSDSVLGRISAAQPNR